MERRRRRPGNSGSNDRERRARGTVVPLRRGVALHIVHGDVSLTAWAQGSGLRVSKRPLLSVVLMLGATASFVAMQAIVKQARESGMDTLEVMFFRTAPGLPALYYVLRRAGHGLRPADPADVLVRSVLGSLAMGTNF